MCHKYIAGLYFFLSKTLLNEKSLKFLGKLFTSTCLCSPSSIVWYQPYHREHNGSIWDRSGHVTELCLHSLPAQGLET